jgi:hypothetical protein
MNYIFWRNVDRRRTIDHLSLGSADLFGKAEERTLPDRNPF